VSINEILEMKSTFMDLFAPLWCGRKLAATLQTMTVLFELPVNLKWYAVTQLV
jgi:hypothetical protein